MDPATTPQQPPMAPQMTNVPPQAPYSQPVNNPGKGFGIASIVLGIIPFLGLFGLVFGIVSIVKSNKVKQSTVLGIVGVVLSALSIFSSIILAALVMTAYQGVQGRAQDAAARTNANSVSAQAEAYYALEGVYPAGAAEMQQIMDENLTASNRVVVIDEEPLLTTNVQYRACGTDGMQVVYYSWAERNTIIKAGGTASSTVLCE